MTAQIRSTIPPPRTRFATAEIGSISTTKLAAIAFVTISVAVGVPLIASRTDAPATLTVTPKTHYTLAQARRFGEFPVYSVGSTFRGLPLSAVNRVKSPRPASGSARHNSLSFLYGSCEIPRDSDDGGCSLPLEIQNWPACERTIAVTGPQGIDEAVTVRGVPGLFSEGYRRLSVATGTTTIFIYGMGREQLLEAARSLRGVNNGLDAQVRLPRPARGALDGTLTCERRPPRA